MKPYTKSYVEYLHWLQIITEINDDVLVAQSRVVNQLALIKQTHEDMAPDLSDFDDQMAQYMLDSKMSLGRK
jgi:hypothetical protein